MIDRDTEREDIDGIPFLVVPKGTISKLARPSLHLYEPRRIEGHRRRTHTSPPGGVPHPNATTTCTFCGYAHDVGKPCRKPRLPLSRRKG